MIIEEGKEIVSTTGPGYASPDNENEGQIMDKLSQLEDVVKQADDVGLLFINRLGIASTPGPPTEQENRDRPCQPSHVEGRIVEIGDMVVDLRNKLQDALDRLRL